MQCHGSLGRHGFDQNGWTRGIRHSRNKGLGLGHDCRRRNRKLDGGGFGCDGFLRRAVGDFRGDKRDGVADGDDERPLG